MGDDQLDLFDAEDPTLTAAPSGRVLAIDAMAFLYRAHYALPELANSEGQPTGALYGFASTLIDLLHQELPSHGFVAFESGGPTLRHQRFDRYKAQRKETPAPLVAQIPVAEELARAAGFCVLKLEGYEADDLLAALAERATVAVPVLIASGDRDLYQLLRPGVELIQPPRPGARGFQRVTEDSFRQRYLLEPRQWIERRALEGDASDNLPGVAGVGEKTASDLVRRYGDLDAIYAHLDELAPGVRKKLDAGREMAYLTRELAVLHSGCRAIDLDEGRLYEHDDARLQELLATLGIRALGQRWARWRAHLRSRAA